MACLVAEVNVKALSDFSGVRISLITAVLPNQTTLIALTGVLLD